MRYSVLLVGKNRMVIEEFFTHMWEEFECLSSSGRYEDLKNHLKYYTPNAIVYCLLEESQENMKQITSLREKMEDANIPLIIAGAKEDCDLFLQYAPAFAELVVEKPFSANTLSSRIKSFLSEKKKEEEERMLQEAWKFEEKRRQEEEKRLLESAFKKAGEEKKRQHILIVDDDPLMLKAIKQHLRDEYDVATAISGKVAMKFLSTMTTDLILLDYEMPEDDGPAVLRMLHENEATKDIPVVFLTGITERDKIHKALVLKPQGYLLKPVDHNKLMETIKNQIG